jgi:hypothetical protein
MHLNTPNSKHLLKKKTGMHAKKGSLLKMIYFSKQVKIVNKGGHFYVLTASGQGT